MDSMDYLYLVYLWLEKTVDFLIEKGWIPLLSGVAVVMFGVALPYLFWSEIIEAVENYRKELTEFFWREIFLVLLWLPMKFFSLITGLQICQFHNLF